jgi:hypothetical protein
VVHQREKSSSITSQKVCVGEDSPFETMARWHQEGNANTGVENEVDQACP